MASAIFPTSANSTHGMSFSSCPMSRATIPQPLQASVSSPRIDYSASSRSAQDPYLSIPEKYRHGSLSGAQKELIKATVPALKAHGVDITKKFYGNMLGNHPELRDIFNNANQEHFEQPRALAQAVLAYAINIDDLTPLGPAVELMAAKHASLYVQPEQYSIVGKHLIEAIGQVLGEAVTPELAEAWTAAYWQLAEILIRREHELYQGAKGWTDWADFKIVKKVMESSEVTSFYLEPVDQAHKPLPAFSPGQFISIQVDVPSLGHRQTRQYSLSEEPNSDYYRISIKRENGANNTTSTAPGLISNLMHDTKNVGDTIRISHPMGDFFLDLNVNDSCPLVLLSGGVGLTPLMSMLNTLVAKDSTRPVSWIHGSRSAVVRPFTRHLKSLERSRENLQVTLFEENPGPDEAEGEDFDCRGIINLEQLDGMKTLFLNDSNAQYYICGPPAFMVKMEKDLLDRGIDPRKIHMEKFGTGGIQRAPQAVS